MTTSSDPPSSSGWVSFWDLSYRDGSYLEYWDPPEIPDELTELVESGEIRPGSAILDIGCGAGREALYLATKGCTVIGLDSSSEALRQARLRQERHTLTDDLDIEWKEGNALALPFDASSFDWVLDRGCFHCIDHEERHRYVSSVERVLRPGGTLLLRGAREDDDEQGLVGIGTQEIDELFPPTRFLRGPVLSIYLEAKVGSLPAVMARIQKIRSV